MFTKNQKKMKKFQLVKRSIGEFWTWYPKDEVEFLDPESPAFNSLRKSEFKGLLKGLNIMFDEVYLSTKSADFEKMGEKYDEFIKGQTCPDCGKQLVRKQNFMGIFLGYTPFCKDYFNHIKNA